MNKCILKKSCALAVAFAFFSLADSAACISKDREAAEKSLARPIRKESPAKKTEPKPPARKPAAKADSTPKAAEPAPKVAKLAAVPIIKERPAQPAAEEKPAPKPPARNPAPKPEPKPIAEEKPAPEPPARKPAAKAEPKPKPAPEPKAREVVAVVDDVVITRQEHLQTKSEVEGVVEELNEITRKKDYNRWLAYLDGEYRNTLSNRSYLAQISNSLPKALRDRRVRLSTLRDYFEYVFVPSRQNVRVDDIQYITPTRVYVIMELASGGRAAVYILEKGNGGSWKLVDRK